MTSLSASRRLVDRSEAIMQQWETRANQEVLCSLNLASLALRNSLPELLLLVADALSTTYHRTKVRKDWLRKEATRVGRKHGRERADCSRYTMSQMISEYHILRQVIFDVLEEGEDELSATEREVIVCAIEQAVNDAATQFSETGREAQEQLAATLTHDLRGPLSAVALAAGRVSRKPEDAAGCAQAAGRIISGAGRLENMIQNLLDASRMKTGRQLPLNIVECDLDEVIKRIVKDLEAAHSDRLVVDMQAHGKVMWDSDEIARVIENLANNALKYGDELSPITLGVHQNADTVRISLHNHGVCIPMDEQAALFEQFQRASTSGTQTGWGLGLTVVKGIVEAHHGSIRVESATESGTSFIIVLPNDAHKSAAEMNA